MHSGWKDFTNSRIYNLTLQFKKLWAYKILNQEDKVLKNHETRFSNFQTTWILENQHVRKRDKSSWDTLGRLKVNWIVFLPIIVKWLSLGGLHFWGFDDPLARLCLPSLEVRKKGWLINDLRDWRWAPDALGGNEETLWENQTLLYLLTYLLSMLKRYYCF